MKKTTKITAALLILAMTTVFATSCISGSSGESESETETYDWGTLAPDEDDGKDAYFSFDKYALSMAWSNVESETFMESYKSLVDAVENRTEQITVLSSDRDNIISALLDSYPLSALLNGISAYNYDEPIEEETTPGDETQSETEAEVPQETVEGETESETEARVIKKTTLTLSFIYGEEEHKKAVEDFYNGAATILSSIITDDMGQARKAIAIYSWVAKNVEDAGSKGIHVLDFVVSKGKLRPGTKEEYPSDGATHAAIFQYLALQAGLECSSVSATLRQHNSTWNIVKLAGENYHLNAAYEYTDTVGLGLKWFGLKDSDVLAEGYETPFSFGFDFCQRVSLIESALAPSTLAAECTSERFSMLRDCNYYEIDGNDIIYYEQTTGEQGRLTF